MADPEDDRRLGRHRAASTSLPRDRPYLFLANHQSIYDIPVLFWHLPYQLRILAKASLGRFPFLGWHLRRSGHVLVDRSNPGNSTMVQIKELMRQKRLDRWCSRRARAALTARSPGSAAAS